MPYGEMLMENTDFSYDNPYKYNAKEFDMATGLYYYGARYYDPKRSFWLSVDPLEEIITNSPYAYVWNDPVNFTDPTGLMGERVGGKGPADWGKKGNQWEWNAKVTKDNYKKLGYSDYLDGYSNNQYNSVNNTTVTLQPGNRWSEVPNTGFANDYGSGISQWGSDIKHFFTSTIFEGQFWGETAESLFSNGHSNISDYGKWNSYQWGHAAGYETPNVAFQAATYALTKTKISFYTVQGAEDVARLKAGGTP